MATGYMVDMRKTLPSGLKNENWRRYVPFEPYAEVVNEYFKIFLEHDGNVYATVRHIEKHGPWYPDSAICKPPEGYKAVYHIYRYEKGYCPGRTGLLTLLTDVAYLGNWTHKDSIVRWNNLEGNTQQGTLYTRVRFTQFRQPNNRSKRDLPGVHRKNW